MFFQESMAVMVGRDSAAKSKDVLWWLDETHFFLE
jgi:hypothetical protein